MQDLILDIDGDLMMESGDLVCAYSDTQHQHLLLASDKGDWKENPTIGVGAHSWLKDDEPAGLLAEVKKEFERDGMKVKKITLTPQGQMDIDASY